MAGHDPDLAKEAREEAIALVSAFAANPNNRLTPEAFQILIRDTFATLYALRGASAEPAAAPLNGTRSQSEISRSIGARHLISFLDDKPYRSLTQHLMARKITPDQYRARFGLPSDYPMTHPDYSAERAEMAIARGLPASGRLALALERERRSGQGPKGKALAATPVKPRKPKAG